MRAVTIVLDATKSLLLDFVIDRDIKQDNLPVSADMDDLSNNVEMNSIS